jgi:hypothetical protein
MREDIPLIFGVPAAALKKRLSGLAPSGSE